MAVPPITETLDERKARLAMLSDLGIERVEDLPAENGENRGITYSLAATASIMSGPAVRAETNSSWLTAINAGDFDDDDAEGVKGLSTMAHGRLHAIRESPDSAPFSSRSSVHLSSRGHRARIPSPYDPQHNLLEPLPQFDNARHRNSNQRPNRQSEVPSPSRGASRVNVGRATPAGLSREGRRHPPAQANLQPSNGQRNTQPARSSPLRNSSSYQLPPTQPANTSQLSNIVLDETILSLQGEAILYRDVAFLHQPSSTSQLPSTVLWITRSDVVEPLFIVAVDNAILHEYPLSHWKDSWGTVPDRHVKFRDSLGIESTFRLTFINHASVAAFVEKQDELAAAFVTSDAAKDTATKRNQTTSTPASTTIEGCTPTTAMTSAGVAPPAATPDASSDPAPQFEVLESPASVLVQAEASLSSNDKGNKLILLDDDTTLAAQDSAKAPKSSEFLQELQSLSPASPANKALVVYGDQAHKATEVDQAAVSDPTIEMCQEIAVKVEQLTQLHLGRTREAREAVRQRLYSGLSKSFKGVADPKRSHVISILSLLFDAATRHNGLQYSVDEMQDLRSNAEPPRGDDFEKTLKRIGAKTLIRKPEDHKSQVAQVAAKRTEDIPSLQFEGQAKSISIPAILEVPSTLADAQLKVDSASMRVETEVSEAIPSSSQITPVHSNVVKVETHDGVPSNMAAAHVLSLSEDSTQSGSVSSQVTQGGRRVGLASSRWASVLNTTNVPTSAYQTGSPINDQPAVALASSIAPAPSTTASNGLVFSSRFREYHPRTSSLIDLSSLEGGGGPMRVPSLESERSADSTDAIDALFTNLSLHSPATDEYQATNRLSLGRGVRNINIPVSESGLRQSDITLI